MLRDLLKNTSSRAYLKGIRLKGTQPNFKKLSRFTEYTNLTLRPSEEYPGHHYVATKKLLPEESLLVSTPYVAVVAYEVAEKFCAHCHVPIGIRSSQSLYNHDFYGFPWCRDFFDEQWKSELHKELRTDLRSRFVLNQHSFKVSMKHEEPIGEEYWTWIKALAEVIAKKTAEMQHKPYPPPFLSRGEGKCFAAEVETGPPQYHPTYADFQSLPLGEESIPNDLKVMFHRISSVIREVLSQRESYKAIEFDNTEMYEGFCRLYTHQRRIIRQSENYGPASDTGFGVYPSMQFIKTAGFPNSEFYFDLNKRLTIRAQRVIEPGEAISIGDFPRLLEDIDPNLGALIHSDYNELKKKFGPKDKKDPAQELYVLTKSGSGTRIVP